MIDYIFAIIFLSIMTICLGTVGFLLIKSRKHWETEYRNMRDKYYDIKSDLYECKRENAEMINKIEIDWPVISNPLLEPAISEQCKNCKYVIKSSWDGAVLKCCKNSVCMNFQKEGEEKE